MMSTGRKCADVISTSLVPCGQPSVFGVKLLSHSLPALTITNLSQITCSAFYKQTNKQIWVDSKNSTNSVAT
jgi:hypothetical protein